MKLTGLAVVVVLILAGAGYFAWSGSKAAPFTVDRFMSHVESGTCSGLSMRFLVQMLGEQRSEAVQRLITELDGSAATGFRQSTFLALYYLNEDAEPAVLRLLEIVVDDGGDERLRRLAIYVLGNQVQHASSIAPVLADILESSEKRSLHADAAMALGMLGSASGDAAWVLGRAMHSTDSLVRARAAESIGAIGPDAATAVPGLISAIDDPDPLVRWWAVDALRKIGPNAAPAVPALVRLLELRASWQPFSGPDPAGDFFERDFLANLSTVPGCTMHAGDGIDIARTRMEYSGWDLAPPVLAARALAAIGPLAVEAIPALNAAAADKQYPNVQVAARYALNEISNSGG